MARGQYGGGAADFVQTVVGNSYHPAAAAAVTMWSAQTGGSLITDLQNAAGGAITSVTTNADGSVPVFYGPDGVASMWADAGGAERVLLLAYNLTALTGSFVSVLDAPISAITYNSDSTIHVVTYGSGLVITYTYNTDGSVHTSSDGTTTRTFTYNSDGTIASVA